MPVGLLGGNQQEQRTRRGWISGAFGGIAVFIIAFLLMKDHVANIGGDDHTLRWSIFWVITGIFFPVVAAFIYIKADDRSTPDHGSKGMLWLAFVGGGISVGIRNTVPDLSILVLALIAGGSLAFVVAPVLLIFVRPWMRKRSVTDN